MFVISRLCTILFPDNNNLIGTIPTEIGLLTSLTVLITGANYDRTGGLAGTIPSEIGLLTSLTYLVFSKSIDQFSRCADCGLPIYHYYCIFPKLAWKPHHFLISYVDARYC
jgi:hypothetical protein